MCSPLANFGVSHGLMVVVGKEDDGFIFGLLNGKGEFWFGEGKFGSEGLREGRRRGRRKEKEKGIR